MAAPQTPDSSDKFKHADELYKQEKWKELFKHLQEFPASDNDPEVAWRMLRCGFRLGNQLLIAGDSREAERIADIAMERGKKALEKNERHFHLHKWTGVILRLFGDIKGKKTKIENAHIIKEHFTRALEIKPQDGRINHLMGRWCYQAASLPWWQRTMASALIATPPTSSYDEALHYFNTAEEVSPGGFKTNWLWLGKTHQKLGRRPEARKWLQKLVDTETVEVDDKEAKVEARTLLRDL